MRYLQPLPKKFKGLGLVAAALLAVCAFFAVFGHSGVLHLWRLDQQQSELESAAYSLAMRNQRLRDHLGRLENDDHYLERLARERLKWIKPGEVVYRVQTRASAVPAQ